MGRYHYSVYVIRLDPSIFLKESRFREKNPDFRGLKPCIYVGMTGISPEERFKNHKEGYKSSRFVKEYGIELMPELYKKLPPMTYYEAIETEEGLAERYRDEGYAVWQN